MLAYVTENLYKLDTEMTFFTHYNNALSIFFSLLIICFDLITVSEDRAGFFFFLLSTCEYFFFL